MNRFFSSTTTSRHQTNGSSYRKGVSVSGSGSGHNRNGSGGRDEWDVKSDDLEKEYGQDADDWSDDDDDDNDEVEMRGLVSGQRPSVEIPTGKPVARAYHLGSMYCNCPRICSVGILVAVCVGLVRLSHDESHKNKNWRKEYYAEGLEEQLWLLDDDWGDSEQEYHKLTKQGKNDKFPDIQRIAILGERNSGVNWFSNKVKECFPDVVVTTSLSRPSFYFQSEELYQQSPYVDVPTAVLALFLNPYAWVDAMIQYPRYSPNHAGGSASSGARGGAGGGMAWKQFLETPWTTARPQRDVEYVQSLQGDESVTQCQLNFTYRQIVSCLDDDDDADNTKKIDTLPRYELRHDNSGLPYESILDLRADKIANFLSVGEWDVPAIRQLIPLQYESFTTDNDDNESSESDSHSHSGGGTHRILQDLATQLNLELQCDEKAQHEVAPTFYSTQPEYPYVKYLNEHVQWEIEWTVGYDFFDFTSANELQQVEWQDPPPVTTKSSSSSTDDVDKGTLDDDWMLEFIENRQDAYDEKTQKEKDLSADKTRNNNKGTDTTQSWENEILPPKNGNKNTRNDDDNDNDDDDDNNNDVLKAFEEETAFWEEQKSKATAEELEELERNPPVFANEVEIAMEDDLDGFFGPPKNPPTSPQHVTMAPVTAAMAKRLPPSNWEEDMQGFGLDLDLDSTTTQTTNNEADDYGLFQDDNYS